EPHLGGAAHAHGRRSHGSQLVVVVAREVGFVDDDVPALRAIAADVDNDVAGLEFVFGTYGLCEVGIPTALHAIDAYGDRHGADATVRACRCHRNCKRWPRRCRTGAAGDPTISA